MPKHPKLIVDLHTHMFNARCLPLPGIIANAMGKDASESPLARATAKLLNRLTEAEYKPQVTFNREAYPVDFFVNQLCELTAYELSAPFRENRSPTTVTQGGYMSEAFNLAQQKVIKSDLYECLRELEKVLGTEGHMGLPQSAFMGVSDVMGWARKIVSVTFHTLEYLITMRDEIKNYAEFFFNMLTSEERMVQTMIKDYGDGLPPLQFVHHMMDMQMAYVTENTPATMVEPKYIFYDTQLLRMQDLDRHNQGMVFGFAAFDPRRPNWRDIFDKAIVTGFKGFKFYPAMGYLPIGNKDLQIEQRVLKFFDQCIEQNIPVFAHCTPNGFQTKLKDGLNAAPQHWEKLLTKDGDRFANLRLCFGHAGGGRMEHGSFTSPGWTASEAEWDDPNNYACTVARLCRTYENVYCEFAYITELIEGSQEEREAAVQRFEKNLLHAIESKADGEYDLAKKMSYGSDWHMPSMMNHPRDYLDVFLRIFDDRKPLSIFREQFFWENTYHYLNLS